MTIGHATQDEKKQQPPLPRTPVSVESEVDQALWDRFAKWLPYFPRCSATSNAVLSRPRDRAVQYPYLTPCRQDFRAWLIFDIDKATPFGHWDDCGLPPPNMIVRSPESGTAHWYYAITPVYLKGRRHPIDYARAVYNAMVAKLGADPEYAGGPVSKNPFHGSWDTICLHDKQYDLSELQEYVELDGQQYGARVSSALLDDNTHSRHLWLFHATRFTAYRMVDEYYALGPRGYDAFFDRFFDIALRHNTFASRSDFGGKPNLRPSQVRAVARSIVDYCWGVAGDPVRRSRCFKNRGVMRFDGALPLSARQALAAKRTHTQKRASSETRIRAAVKAMLNAGEKLSFVAIAQAARLTRQTVAKYKAVIEHIRQIHDASTSKERQIRHPQKASLLAVPSVNFGEVKITTPFINAAYLVRSTGARPRPRIVDP